MKNDDYEVGYGKPPKEHQWKKGGPSPNPRGRPRKVKPAQPVTSGASEAEFLGAMDRIITVVENGERIKMTVGDANARTLATRGVTGGRLDIKQAFELKRRLEDEALRNRLENYWDLLAIKRNHQKILDQHLARGTKPPVLLPHPDDIFIDAFAYRAWVVGPENKEQLVLYEASECVRDYALAYAEWQERCGVVQHAVYDGKEFPMLLVLATFIQSAWPPSMRPKADESLTMQIALKRLRKRELWRVILLLQQAMEDYLRLLPPLPEGVQATLEGFFSRSGRADAVA